MGRRTFELKLPPYLRALPADLAALIALTGLTTIAVFFPVINTTPLRVALGLPFILFVPGYALVAALFPEAGESSPAADDPSDRDDLRPDEPDGGGIDGIERVALSFGLSIAVVPLIGLVLNFTPWGIRLVPIVVALNGFVIASTVVAARRRWDLPPESRFAVPYQTWIATARSELFKPETNTDLALNVLLVVSILLATASVGYAVAVPQQGERFTEFYLLTESDNGELVADEYPTEYVAGEPRSLVVGIGNQERRPVTYTVIVEIQRVDIVDNETVVRESQQLRRFQPQVNANETWTQPHTVAPQLTGERLRLQYLLYRESPDTPLNRSAAYRELHLWVNVTAASTETSEFATPTPT
jgi:uncharacterized membrane protein